MATLGEMSFKIGTEVDSKAIQDLEKRLVDLTKNQTVKIKAQLDFAGLNIGVNKINETKQKLEEIDAIIRDLGKNKFKDSSLNSLNQEVRTLVENIIKLRNNANGEAKDSEFIKVLISGLDNLSERYKRTKIEMSNFSTDILGGNPKGFLKTSISSVENAFSEYIPKVRSELKKLLNEGNRTTDGLADAMSMKVTKKKGLNEALMFDQAIKEAERARARIDALNKETGRSSNIIGNSLRNAITVSDFEIPKVYIKELYPTQSAVNGFISSLRERIEEVFKGKPLEIPVKAMIITGSDAKDMMRKAYESTVDNLVTYMANKFSTISSLALKKSTEANSQKASEQPKTLSDITKSESDAQKKLLERSAAIKDTHKEILDLIGSSNKRLGKGSKDEIQAIISSQKLRLENASQRISAMPDDVRIDFVDNIEAIDKYIGRLNKLSKMIDGFGKSGNDKNAISSHLFSFAKSMDKELAGLSKSSAGDLTAYNEASVGIIKIKNAAEEGKKAVMDLFQSMASGKVSFNTVGSGLDGLKAIFELAGKSGIGGKDLEKNLKTLSELTEKNSFIGTLKSKDRDAVFGGIFDDKYKEKLGGLIKFANSIMDNPLIEQHSKGGKIGSQVSQSVDGITINASLVNLNTQNANAVSYSASRRGGKVKGGGTQVSDSVATFLSRDEYVMNAFSTKDFEPILALMNKIRGGASDVKMVEKALSGLSKAYPDNAAFSSSLDKMSRGARLSVGDFASLGAELQKVLGLELQFEKHQGGGKSGSGSTIISKEALAINNLGLEIESCDKKLKNLNANLKKTKEGSPEHKRNTDEINRITAQRTALSNERTLRNTLSSIDDGATLAAMLSNAKEASKAAKNTPAFDMLKEQERIIADVINLRKIDVDAIKEEDSAIKAMNKTLTEYRQKVRDLQEKSYTLEKRGKSNIGTQREIGIYQGMIRHYEGMMNGGFDTDQMNAALANMRNFDNFMRKHGERRFNLMNQNGDQSIREEKATWKAIEDNYNTQRKLREQSAKDAKKESDAMDALKDKYTELAGAFRIMREQERGGLFGKKMTSAQQGMISLMREVKTVISSGDYEKAMDRAFSSHISSRQGEYAKMILLQRQINANSRNNRPADTVYMESWLQGRIDKVVDSYNLIKTASAQAQYAGPKTNDALQKLIEQYRELINLQKALKSGSIFDNKSKSFVNFGASDFIAATKDLRTRGTVSRTIETAQSLKFAQGRDNTIARNAQKQFDDEVKYIQGKLAQMNQYYLSLLAKRKTGEIGGAGVDAGIKDLKNLIRYMKYVQGSPSLLHGFVSGNVFGSSIANVRGQIDRQAIANRQQAKIDSDNTNTFKTLESVIGNVESKLSSLRVLQDRLIKEGKGYSYITGEISKWQTYLSSLTAGRASVNAASVALSGYKNVIRSMEEETGKAINSQNVFNRQQANNAKSATSASNDYERTMQKMRNAYKSAEIAWNKIDFLQSIGVDGQKLRDAKTQVEMLYKSLGSAINTGNIKVGKDILFGNSRQDSFAMQMKNVGELMFENGKLNGIDTKNISKVANAYSRLKSMLDNAVVDRGVLAAQGKGTAKMDSYISDIRSYMSFLSGIGTDANKAKTAIVTLDAEMRKLNKDGRSARKLQVVDNNSVETQKRNAEQLNNVILNVSNALKKLKEEQKNAARDGKDTSHLDEIIRKYERYSQALAKASGDAAKTANQVRISGRTTQYLGSQATIARMLDKSFNLDSISGRNAGDKIRKMMTALDLEIKKLDNKFVKGTRIKIDNTDAIKKIENLKSLLSGFYMLSGKQRKIRLETEIRKGTFSNGLTEARMMAGKNYEDAARFNKQQKEISSELMSQSRLSQELGNMIGNAFSIYTLQNFLRNLIQIGGEMQKQHIALQSILGDEARANALFSDLKGLAVNSPFKFGQLASYSKQLAAFSIPYDEMYDTTKRLADISAGLGVDMSRIILAYGQVRSAAFLRGQEVRQFTEAGIPLLDKLADKFSAIEGRAVSAGEVFDRISKREVSFDMVKDVLWGLTDEGGQFYNMQDKLIDSLSGKMTKLADQYEIALANLAENHKESIGGVIDMLVSLTSHLEEAVAVGGGMLAMFAAFKATTFIGGLVELIRYTKLFTIAEISTISATNLAEASMIKLAKGIKVVKTALMSLGKAGWVGVLLSAIAAVGLYIYNTRKEAEALSLELDKIAGESRTAVDKEVLGYKELVRQLGKCTEGTNAYSEVINKINSQYGQYLDGLYNEADAYEKIAESVDSVTSAITKRYAEEQYQKSITAINEEYGENLNNWKNNIISYYSKDQLISDKDGKKISDSYMKDVSEQIINGAFQKLSYSDFSNSDELKRKIKEIVDEVADASNVDKNVLGNIFSADRLASSFGVFKGYFSRLDEAKSKIKGYDPYYLYSDEIDGIKSKYNALKKNTENKNSDRIENLKIEKRMYEEITELMKKRGATENNKYLKEYNSKLKEVNDQLQKFVTTAHDVIGTKFQDLLPGKNDVGDFMGYIKRLAEVYKNTVTEIGDLEKLDSSKQSSADTKSRLERDRNRKEALDRLAEAYGINWADWGGKGSSKKAESELKALNARLELYKKVEELRDKAIQHGSSASSAWDFVKNNDDSAFNALSELEKWQNAQSFTYEDFLKKNEDFRNELRKKLGASSKVKDEDLYKMLVSALNWIEDVNFKNIDKEVERGVALFNQRIEDTTKKWNFYKTIKDATGNALTAARLAFGDSSVRFESEFDLLFSEFSKRVSGTALDASDWKSLIGLSDSDVAEYIYGKAYDEKNPKHKQNIKEIIDLVSKLKSAQDSQIDEFRNAISDAINLYPDVIKYGMERNRIEEEYIRLKKLAKTEEEKELLEFRQNSKLLDLDVREFKNNPLNNYALNNISNLTKKQLNDLEDAIREKFGEDIPETLKQAMKEVYDWRDSIFNEKSSREFFGGISKALSDYNKAKEDYDEKFIKRDLAKANYDGYLSDVTATEEEIAEAKEELANADLALANAEDKLVRSLERVKKSFESIKNNIQSLGGVFSKIGGAIGGDLGNVLNSFGSTISSIPDMMSNIAKGGMSAVGGYVSGVIALYDVSKTLSESIDNMQYEHYKRAAAKQAEINSMKDAVYEYARAVDEANAKERDWFASTSLSGIHDVVKQMSAARKAFDEEFNEYQVAYNNEKHGGWGNYFVAGLATAAAAVVSIYTLGTGATAAAGALAAAYEGLGLSFSAATVAGAATLATAAGVAGSAIYGAGNALANVINEADGRIKAWANLMIETREKDNGFWGTGWGGHDQETQHIQSWLNESKKAFDAYVKYKNRELSADEYRKALGASEATFGLYLNDNQRLQKEFAESMVKMGLDNFNLWTEERRLNSELVRAMLENETLSSKLQGETKETLETLLKYEDQYQEALDKLREYISQMASPIVDNMVDAIWDWFDNGVDALDSFKEKATDTFRSIASEIIKTMMLGNIFDEYKSDLEDAMVKYGDGRINEEELGNQLAIASEKLLGKYEEALPTAEKALEALDETLKSHGYDNGLENTGSSSSASSSIRGVTEETADILAAYLNGIRLDVSVDRSLLDLITNYHLPLIEELLGYNAEEAPFEDVISPNENIIAEPSYSRAMPVATDDILEIISPSSEAIVNTDAIMQSIGYVQLPMLNATAAAQLAQLNQQTEYLRQINESNNFLSERVDMLASDLHSVIYGGNRLQV